MERENYAIIMAGGIGSRFWPLSRTSHPKQFLDVLGTGKTLLQQTCERIKRVCTKENILILTNRLYENTIREQIRDVPPENILCEPQRKNTAPCIAYGAFKIKKRDAKANILVAPSDHVILKEDLFMEIVREGFNFVSRNDALLTIGIKPHRPETGYGYIRSAEKPLEEEPGKWTLAKVRQFTEKPDLATAMAYLESGDYFWNAGIFIWSVDSILAALQKYMPGLHGQFLKYQETFDTPDEKKAVEDIFETCENISVDYGVMEKAGNVYVMSADIGWSDLGSWSALHEMSHTDPAGNTTNSNKTLFYDTGNCLVRVPGNKVAVIQGLDNYVVVEDENALLICKKQEEQRIRQFVEDVETRFGKQYV
ncbi:MAG: mannose-1-phosphate guanylyltransferase [Bacteroidales bacterium]